MVTLPVEAVKGYDVGVEAEAGNHLVEVGGGGLVAGAAHAPGGEFVAEIVQIGGGLLGEVGGGHGVSFGLVVKGGVVFPRPGA